MHTDACNARALDMARENGAPDDATAEAWLAMWDADGGRGNYGACTCCATPRRRPRRPRAVGYVVLPHGGYPDTASDAWERA